VTAFCSRLLIQRGLMDANGDGKLSLEEFQAAHERIFKAMDADHDGTVTLEEMQAFMRGH
jgi:Ca2+-binding EF-hand superfamily protein